MIVSSDRYSRISNAIVRDSTQTGAINILIRSKHLRASVLISFEECTRYVRSTD